MLDEDGIGGEACSPCEAGFFQCERSFMSILTRGAYCDILLVTQLAHQSLDINSGLLDLKSTLRIPELGRVYIPKIQLYH